MATSRLLPPTSEQVPDNGHTTVEIPPSLVGEQLERILASAAFRSSKRTCILLRHVVERTLEGRVEELRERSIGADVFGRPADYDTNADHVVRSVAGDVRRRLAQYYVEAAADSEVRIELLAGSYVPQFRFPTERPAAPSFAPAAGAEADAAPWKRRWWILAASALLLVAVVFTPQLANQPTSLQSFWGPVLTAPEPVLLCVGGGDGATPSSEVGQPVSVVDFATHPSRRIHAYDAIVLASVTGVLRENGKPYRMLNRASATSFKDLQSGPFVLIGGMNNEWTLRLLSNFRFSLARDERGARIADRQQPSNKSWGFDRDTPFEQLNRDYAIVSRVRDPQTEQTAVIIAGIGAWATLAAGELVTNPEFVKKLEAFVPRDWSRKNLQVVISTDVIRGSPGPPNVLAAHVW